METKEQIEEKIWKLTEGEYVSLGRSSAILDGMFDSNQLRAIADAIDQLKVLDLQDKSEYNE